MPKTIMHSDSSENKEKIARNKNGLWSNFETLRGIRVSLKKVAILIEQLEKFGVNKQSLDLIAEALAIDVNMLGIEFPELKPVMRDAWKKYTGDNNAESA